MQIANRNIGPNEKPLVIAEIGINHGGDVRVAKHMVQLAAKSWLRMHQTSDAFCRRRNDGRRRNRYSHPMQICRFGM